MEKRFILVFIVGVFFLVIIRADVPSIPDPTHKTLNVYNYIININNFTNYYFFSYTNGPCPPSLIESNGLIPVEGPKFCTSSTVFAIKRTDFDKLNKSRYNLSFDDSDSSLMKILYNENISTIVLNEIGTQTTVSSSDSRNLIVNEYKINESLLKRINNHILNESIYYKNETNKSISNQSIRTIEKRDYTIYLFLLIPLIAIIIVFWIIILRRINKK